MSPQHSLHAAHADAVALGQRTMRGARAAAPNKLEDYLFAKAINQPPATLRLRRSGWVATVALDPRCELANRHDQGPHIGVRNTSP
jgi:hypothetical protein